MDKPITADTKPCKVELEKDKVYFWCACGRSKKQPFCDGTHKTTDLSPIKFSVPEAKTVYLCQCKQSHNKPYCDGTHKTVIKTA